MYFVDRDKIEKTLDYLEKILGHIDDLSPGKDVKEQLALERLTSNVIESIIDVGNSMIDGFIMRDPGSYEDIIDILEDESVVDNKNAVQLKSVITLRKHLVFEYTSIQHPLLYQTLKDNLKALTQFPNDIRKYLQEELGPVSAFLPQDHK